METAASRLSPRRPFESCVATASAPATASPPPSNRGSRAQPPARAPHAASASGVGARRSSEGASSVRTVTLSPSSRAAILTAKHVAAAASTTSVRAVVDGLAVNLGVRATAASTAVAEARCTVEYAALRTLPQASSTGTTNLPTTFGRQKSRVCAAPASRTGKARHRSTYAIILPNRSSCKGVRRKWFCGHFSNRGSTAASAAENSAPPKNARPSASAPSSSLRCAATRSRHASASIPSQNVPSKMRVHLAAKGPSGKSWTKCGLACRDRTI
mmetsp:Transcript_9362/g.29092  ORF Transcript_9362/g.29092 Transcript_9362/m.29092 type:complete len:272 (+) Transcript_9362:466-1281(+)